MLPGHLSGASCALAIALVALHTPAQLHAQRPDTAGMQPAGPVIQSAGPTWKVERPTFEIPAGHEFKQYFVVNRGDPEGVSEQLTTVARFLNVHVRHGVPKEKVHAAAVVHGTGWISLLSDSAHAARYGGAPNPSRRLVEELLANGTVIVLCGQTAGARGVKTEELIRGVRVGISAMTAVNVLESQGYRYNPW